MATEEIHLNDHLEAHGITCVETDLGERIQQLEDTVKWMVQLDLDLQKESDQSKN